jgi:hypothetical protein
MPTTLAISDPATWTVDEQFLDLICNDQDLLAAEFDAIIAAEWPGPPANPPGHGATSRHLINGAGRRVTARVRGAVSQPPHPGIGGWARQRSPPFRYPDQRQTGRQVIATREPTLTR